jgi:hypothetical protein
MDGLYIPNALQSMQLCRSSAIPLFHAIFTLSTFYRLINLQCRVDEHGMNTRSRPGLLQALTGSLPQPLQAVPALVGAALKWILLSSSFG